MEPENSSRKWKTQANQCLNILAEVRSGLEHSNIPADRTLAGIYRSNPCFGSRDRRFFARTIFAFFRWQGWILKSKTLADADERKKLLAALAADGIETLFPPLRIYLEELGIPAHSFPLLSEENTPEERFRAFTGDTERFPDSALIPDWTHEFLAPGADMAFLPFLKTRSPLWCRVLRGAAEEVLEEWKSLPMEPPSRHPHLQNAFRLSCESLNYKSSPAWKRGLFEIQDFASQCIGETALASPGEKWFDPCAGAGGKSLLLADAVGTTGSVSVFDRNQEKLRELAKRTARTPFRDIVRRTDSIDPENYYDGVLLDAPCSSSGRWRRNPEMKWTLNPEHLRKLAETQYRLLCNAASHVRPGGTLVYGTCSIFSMENTLVANRFLRTHADSFEPAPFPSPVDGKPVSDAMLQIFPADADCDGAFAARFRRKGSGA